MGFWQAFLVLQATYDDTRSYTNFLSKCLNRSEGDSIPFSKKTTVICRRDEPIPGEGIGLFFFFSVQSIALYKNFLSAMFENMPGLMKKGNTSTSCRFLSLCLAIQPSLIMALIGTFLSQSR